jgi:hypothetical protein
MKMRNNIQISILILILILNGCINSVKSLKTENIELNFKIITSDIDNFWQAYDSLKNTNDSISIIQRLYLDKTSPELQKIIEIRPDFTAKNFVKSIKDYPKFWTSVRSCTKITTKKKELITNAFLKIKQIYPDFNIPDICFGITPASFGGTTSSDDKVLFIGSEIVLADSSVIVTEFKNILKDLIGTFDVLQFVIHEGIHTAQAPLCEPGVLSETMTEGSADFLAFYILNNNFNSKIYQYGYQNECKIWDLIKVDLEKNQNYDSWFGSYDKNEHPDLGYFIGFRIVQSYFEKSTNKNQALIEIIQMKQPKEIYDKSSYSGNCINNK